MSGLIRMFGIDPGLNRCGWGVVEADGPRLRYLAHGVVKPPSQDPLSERLRNLYEGLRAAMQRASLQVVYRSMITNGPNIIGVVVGGVAMADAVSTRCTDVFATADTAATDRTIATPSNRIKTVSASHRPRVLALLLFPAPSPGWYMLLWLLLLGRCIATGSHSLWLLWWLLLLLWWLLLLLL